VSALLVCTGARADQQQPGELIDRLHTKLLEVMQNAESLGFSGRYNALEPVLSELFDHPVMAQVAVGQFWSTLTEAEQQKLVDVFRKFAIAEYASRFDGYSGQQFRTLAVEPGAKGTTVVKTEITKGKGDPIALTYLLLPDDNGGWRIIDVFLKGTISELAKRRSEYVSVMKRSGYAALIQAVERKTAALASGA
jgi:phospholipid transport system substrate-binding protein